MNTPSVLDYVRLLEQWLPAAEAHLYTPPDRLDLTCYGTGYNTWGVQTNQKALAAYAVLAADPEFDSERAGVSREDVLDRALRMLRFSLESHIEGTYHCTDGEKWGHTWISVLGVERMMHAVELIEPHLTDTDRDVLRRVLVSESDWLLDEYEIVAGLVNNNKPESNIWNGAVLHRTAMMFPDTPRADEYRDKGSRFLVNGISIPSDADCTAAVDGRLVRDWFVGPNFDESFSLNHHLYLNVGYMVICLSNIAMLHFAYRRRGLRAPQALYWHAEELWQLVKLCTFPDGRLARIGGDTRVRYCYCQDYAIPTWLFALDRYGDTDCRAFEAGWLNQVQCEVAANGDGSFLSQRCEQLGENSPLYLTRLESDRAAALSMGACWRRQFDEFDDAETGVPAPTQGAWHDDYHGAWLARGKRRLASWTWLAGERPQGMCLPVDGSDMAEWRENLTGTAYGVGRFNFFRFQPGEYHGASFPGGFWTSGTIERRSEGHIAEGQGDETTAVHDIAFVALPDDASVVVFQRATAPTRVFLSSVKGLLLRIPNDMFNHGERTYHCANGGIRLGGPAAESATVGLGDRWVSIDERLSVVGLYGPDELTILRPAGRQIGIRLNRHQPNTDRGGGMLYADEICYPGIADTADYHAGTRLYDIACLLVAGADRGQAEALANATRSASLNHKLPPDMRGVRVPGQDGRQYLVCANFADTTQGADIAQHGTATVRCIDTNTTQPLNDGRFRVQCPAGAVRVYEVSAETDVRMHEQASL